jgi:hypothetical protein
MRSYFCFNRILAGVICLLLTVTLFYACSKNANDDPKTSNSNDNFALAAAGDQAIVSSYFYDLFVVALEIADNSGYTQARQAGVRRIISGELTSKLGTCINYTADITTWPRIFTVTFGAGCTDSLGRLRAGNLEISMSSYFYYTDAVIVIKPTTYTVNGISVTGTQTIKNVSTNDQYRYTSEIANGLVTLDTTTVKYGGSGIYILLSGSETLNNINDDVFSYTGMDSLVYPSGKAAYITVADSSALQIKTICGNVTKGKATVAFGDLKAIVDYGNGICDDSIVVTLGDKVKSVVLPK